jgi:MHS family alpha-ketoglutarate permease-like MFS transporter
LWFKQVGAESGFYWYLTATIAMAAIAFVMLPETKTASQILED